MQWLYVLLCAYDGFYGNYLYNGFLCRLFPLKLSSVWKKYFEICKHAFLNIWKIVSGI